MHTDSSRAQLSELILIYTYIYIHTYMYAYVFDCWSFICSVADLYTCICMCIYVRVFMYICIYLGSHMPTHLPNPPPPPHLSSYSYNSPGNALLRVAALLLVEPRYLSCALNVLYRPCMSPPDLHLNPLALLAESLHTETYI